jgi:RNA polymerase sigma-70 factor (ECF subfamily)
MGLEERGTIQELEGVLTGDREKVRAFVERVTPVIQARVARLLLKNYRAAAGDRIREEVADLSQEVFVALFAEKGRVLRGWDPDKGLSLLNYVGLVAHRLTVSALRTRKRNPFTEEPTEDASFDVLREGSPSADAQVTSRDLLHKVFQRTEAGLSPTGRKLFRLIFIEERDVGEITGDTGMTDAAVYAWKSRLNKTLKAEYRAVLAESGRRGREHQGDHQGGEVAS